MRFAGKKFNRVSATESTIDYKELDLLRNHTTSETGKIVPPRVTGTTARLQRKLAKAIKQARFLALLPFCEHK